MKEQFIDENFLLENSVAEELFHNYASDLPIIDYHCHLPPAEIADDINFKNLTHIWLNGDHYKWRAMRTTGVDENKITGEATDREKFIAWARTVPKTLKNPLYHWTHMELKNPFGISDRLLNEESAELIWEECNEMLQEKDFSARGILKKNKVKVVATTDDPTDSMEHHKKVRSENTDFIMVPTFRPDRGMEIEDAENFQKWVRRLEHVSNINITTFKDFLKALKSRHDAFHELGCRASDHGIDQPFSDTFTDAQVAEIFDKAMSGKEVNQEDCNVFKSAFLYYCGIMNNERNWVYQLHIGALRNNNSRMLKILGRDTGFDSIGDFTVAASLAKMLNRLDTEDQLPKTVLYNCNPRDNELFSTMIGNFQDGSVEGKLQHGPPWWFLDQKDGIEKQIESLSNMGVLYEFIGMTTDSRSFLSYPRHDYFRRILANLLGKDIEKGFIPKDLNLVGSYLERISFLNAKKYFGFEI